MPDGIITGSDEPTLANLRACRDLIEDGVKEFATLNRIHIEWDGGYKSDLEISLKQCIQGLACRGELRHFRYPKQFNEHLCICRHSQKKPGPYFVGEFSGRTWTEVTLLILSHSCDLLREFETRFIESFDVHEVETLATQLREIWRHVRQTHAHHEASIEINEAIKAISPIAPPQPPVQVTISLFSSEQQENRGLAGAAAEMEFDDPLLVLLGEDRLKVYKIARDFSLGGEKRFQEILREAPDLAGWDSPTFGKLLSVEESTVRKWDTWRALQVKLGKRPA